MIRVLIFVSIISIIIITTSTDDVQPLESSIRQLKDKIIEEIKGNTEQRDSVVYKDMYDYVENSNKPVASTNEPDKPKPEIMFKELEVGELKITTPEKFANSPEKVDEVGPLRIRKHKSKKSKKAKRTKKKDSEIFYRRAIFDGSARDKPQKWTHCLDLLSPFLNGILSNVTHTKKVEATDSTIRRLSYLLSLNMSDASTDEIRAILFELSTLQLRVFQWDIGAIRHILNVIIHNFQHDFRGLKYGIKSLFASWKLNTSNLTRVLTQSRIFRPPCLQITTDGGSTVTPRQDHSRFTKRPIKPHCNRRDDDDQDCLDAVADNY